MTTFSHSHPIARTVDPQDYHTHVCLCGQVVAGTTFQGKHEHLCPYCKRTLEADDHGFPLSAKDHKYGTLVRP